ncbi:trypsin-like peptidase domain-containing protein [Bradyrhizobium yuanmingense]|uniref:trypsin-like peptidase domain-containing protein n=1 Tax=Bradyrhizobium yuanmingense TaxID=108015 RepID=UPI000685AACA|nr:trypsin-like peptidase domain-containing protein [Bradyrhizobium yuanmingense]
MWLKPERLEGTPSKWGHRALAQLNEALANLYPLDSDARRIAAKVGLRTAHIKFEGKAITTWFHVLEYANSQRKIDDILFAALEDYPNDDTLLAAQMGAPPPPVHGPKWQVWNGPAATSTLEKVMGTKSTLVPISYLETGLLRARSVARVKRDDGSSGTGFIIDGETLITNHHVLPDQKTARSSIVQFNYQQTIDGLSAPMEEVRLLPETLKTSKADDWSAVKVAGNVCSRWGSLSLTKSTIAVGDHVNVVQHPGGGPKQISLFSNVVVFVGHGRVQYLTDTLPGASGSPVFDANWNVVAVHHSGGWLTEPHSASKSTYYRNEGICINRIIGGLSASKSHRSRRS